MAKISITRALTEIKTIRDRMEDTFTDTVLVGRVLDGKVEGKSTDDLAVKANSALQKFDDLFDRRIKLKAAVVESNAKTIVTINGKTMTVADAIELRANISDSLMLLNAARHQIEGNIRLINQHNSTRQAGLDALLKANIDASGGVVNEASLKAITDSFTEKNFMTLFDPLDALTAYKEREKEVNDFLTEVDFTLSESNTVTQIEVE